MTHEKRNLYGLKSILFRPNREKTKCCVFSIARKHNTHNKVKQYYCLSFTTLSLPLSIGRWAASHLFLEVAIEIATIVESHHVHDVIERQVRLFHKQPLGLL